MGRNKAENTIKNEITQYVIKVKLTAALLTTTTATIKSDEVVVEIVNLKTKNLSVRKHIRV